MSGKIVRVAGWFIAATEILFLANAMRDREGTAMARHTVESRIALAMLPLGAAITLASVLAVVALTMLAATLMWRWPADLHWWLTWTAAAGAAACYGVRKGIETMSTFDWHVTLRPLTLGAVAALSYPAWWL